MILYYIQKVILVSQLFSKPIKNNTLSLIQSVASQQSKKKFSNQNLVALLNIGFQHKILTTNKHFKSSFLGTKALILSYTAYFECSGIAKR